MSNDKFDTARQVLRQQKLTGERALFQSENLAVYDSVFEDGESPLKESSSLYLDNCLFRWKYPLWIPGISGMIWQRKRCCPIFMYRVWKGWD